MVLVVVLAGFAWLDAPPGLTAAQAVDASVDAFAAMGRADATVDPAAKRGTYEHGDDTVKVWRTKVEMPEGTVRLWVARKDGAPVYVDDLTPDGTGRLLTDAEVGRLASYEWRRPVRQQVWRNLVATLAAALIAVVSIRLASMPPPPPPPPPPVIRPVRQRALRAAKIDP